MKGYATYLARNRALIEAQAGGIVSKCNGTCKWFDECSRMAPDNPVMCELSDEDAELSPVDNARMRQMAASDDDADYYWQATIKMPCRAGGCE